jgi:hypothetical protein
MRLIFIVVLAVATIYWLSGQGILNFDNAKAKTYINSALDKLDSGAGGSRALKEMPNVDNEVSRLCTELKELSDRSLRLRQKLLTNVVESTDPGKTAKRESAQRYKN